MSREDLKFELSLSTELTPVQKMPGIIDRQNASDFSCPSLRVVDDDSAISDELLQDFRSQKDQENLQRKVSESVPIYLQESYIESHEFIQDMDAKENCQINFQIQNDDKSSCAPRFSGIFDKLLKPKNLIEEFEQMTSINFENTQKLTKMRNPPIFIQENDYSPTLGRMLQESSHSSDILNFNNGLVRMSNNSPLASKESFQRYLQQNHPVLEQAPQNDSKSDDQSTVLEACQRSQSEEIYEEEDLVKLYSEDKKEDFQTIIEESSQQECQNSIDNHSETFNNKLPLSNGKNQIELGIKSLNLISQSESNSIDSLSSCQIVRVGGQTWRSNHNQKIDQYFNCMSQLKPHQLCKLDETVLDPVNNESKNCGPISGDKYKTQSPKHLKQILSDCDQQYFTNFDELNKLQVFNEKYIKIIIDLKSQLENTLQEWQRVAQELDNLQIQINNYKTLEQNLQQRLNQSELMHESQIKILGDMFKNHQNIQINEMKELVDERAILEKDINNYKQIVEMTKQEKELFSQKLNNIYSSIYCFIYTAAIQIIAYTCYRLYICQ